MAQREDLGGHGKYRDAWGLGMLGNLVYGLGFLGFGVSGFSERGLGFRD